MKKNIIIATSLGKSVRVWSLKTGELICNFGAGSVTRLTADDEKVERIGKQLILIRFQILTLNFGGDISYWRMAGDSFCKTLL